MPSSDVLIWVAFIVPLVGMLALDLFVFHRNAHTVTMREAGAWSAVWIALGLAFGGLIWAWRGPEAAGEYLAGYLIEKSLSVDNIFIFALIFTYFAVPAAYQHRILFWGVVGAIVLRAIFVAAGAALLHNFHWMIYGFGALLIFTAYKMAVSKEGEVHPERNPVLGLVRRFVPMTTEYHGQSFFIRDGGRWIATPLFAVLVVVETTDVVFAVDSIPAIFAITQDPFLVYTSNAFAILGLRALYFLLAEMLNSLVFLKPALAAILAFVGAKMLLADVYKVPIVVSLSVIATILAIGVIASWIHARRSRGTNHEVSESRIAPEGTVVGLANSTEEALGNGPADGAPASSSRVRHRDDQSIAAGSRD
ncbi:MAG: TerC family protein [Chloroflexota bacterium]